MSYEDILYLPHPVSKKHPQMPMIDRAAQFAPFAALTGHGDMIQETERLTQPPTELTDSAKAELNGILQMLTEGMTVIVKLFIPDSRKEGGAYVERSGQIQKVDALGQCLILTDGTLIPFHAIINLEIAG